MAWHAQSTMASLGCSRLRKAASSRLAVVLLLGLYWLMSVSATRQKSPTFDETSHLTAGYAYWHLADYRLGNGVFLQRWATIPTLGCGLRFPPPHDPDWQGLAAYGGTRRVLCELGVDQKFFYELGNPIDSILLHARAMSALLGVALGLSVYLWSRHLFGRLGALLSLVIFVFCPLFLGNGALVKADVATALFFLLSTWAWWTLTHKISAGTVLTSALATSALVLTKMSAPIVGVTALLITVARLCSNTPTLLCWRTRHRTLGRGQLGLALIPLAVVHVSVAVLLIWASFGFRYSVLNVTAPGVVDSRYSAWDAVTQNPDLFIDAVSWMRQRQLLPEAFLYDLADSYQNTQVRAAFLNGKYSVIGWSMFFPYTLLVKTPLPVFAVFGLAVAALVCQRRDRRLLYGTLPLWILGAVYGVFSIRSHINIGHRHLLPIYPVLYVLAGAAAYWFDKRPRVGAAAVTLALLILVCESLCIRPHYLAYFNLLAGGPRQGYRHLVDSSLDWGQDLPGLKRWLEQEGLTRSDGATPVYLSYFGTGDPRYYGIPAERLPGLPDWGTTLYTGPLRGGVYCISATTLQHVYSPLMGHWTESYELLYRRVLANLDALERTRTDPQSRQRVSDAQGDSFRSNQVAMSVKLRFARLCAYLRQREPDASIGYSILIYRLSDQQVQDALYGPPAELIPEIQVRGYPIESDL